MSWQAALNDTYGHAIEKYNKLYKKKQQQVMAVAFFIFQMHQSTEIGMF